MALTGKFGAQQTLIEKDPRAYLDNLVKQGRVMELPNGEYQVSPGAGNVAYKQILDETLTQLKKVQPPNPYNTSVTTPTPQVNPGVSSNPYNYPTPITPTQGTLEEKKQLIESQINNFGSPDPGLVKEVAALEAAAIPPPPPTPTQAASPSPTTTITNPMGGIEAGTNIGGRDEGKLLAEAELAKQLRQQSYDQTTASRQKMLDDLSSLLIKQQQAQLSDSLPSIYEDLNTRGLLRSSALGDRVSTEQARLARQTSEALAQQGLADRNQALNQLTGIEESYLTGRESALGRRFSLEDYARQIAASKELGALAMPVQQAQPSGKGGSALQGGLGGAATGAAATKSPWGALAGGALGILGGGALGSKN